MRRIYLLLALICTSITSFGQGNPLNDGNDAMKAKNYPEAIKQYETYFGGDEAKQKENISTTYALSTAYMKNKNYDKAINLFEFCIKNNYKPDFSVYQKGMCLKYKGDKEGYFKSMQTGLNTYTSSSLKSKFVGNLANYYNEKALVSFNEGNSIAAAASSNAGTYSSEMAKAFKKYDVAQKDFDQTLAIDPNNEIVKQAMEVMKANRKAAKEYEASLKK